MLRPLTSLRSLFRPAGILCGRHGAPTSLELRNSFTTSVVANLKQLPPRPKHPPESEIEESYLKGSGPGGQKINKTNSAVQLKHIPTGLVIKSQATRSRTQNRKIARDLLALKLDELANGAQSRVAIVSDTKRKRAASKAKKSRRKYRKLAGAEGEVEGEEGEEGELEGGVGEGREQQHVEGSVGAEEGVTQRENGEGGKKEEGR
ncbi:RF-1 domain-containing protein [Chaetomium tenue]|uniref:RF-1 domain-containing protein n=1 Tax=Chaetomium tenue TaxID=1854479 RepID=A0ACB7PJ79_9PEZI|nr:RF-1 domain-containing protein [Chaetomium globosum]